MEENKNIQANEPENQQENRTPAAEVVEQAAEAQEQAVEQTPEQESAVEPQSEPKAEPAAPAAASVEAVAAPAKPKAKSKKSGKTSFGKIFLAALLAVVAGSALITVFWIALLSGVGAMMQPATKSVPESAVLRIDFSENLVDAPSKNPMASFDFASMTASKELTIYKALRGVEAAANDDRIKGIYIDVSLAGNVEVTALEELRAALVEFKKSGKFIVAYGDNYLQWYYYLCSVADKIYIQPEGGFQWTGVALNTVFFKGLLDKLGVEIEILRPTACRYKSAVEPVFLTKMSDANREQMQHMATTMWGVLTEAVSKSRGVSVEKLNELADNLAVVLPADAIEHKLVDGALYLDQVEETMKSEYNIDKLNYVTLGDYAAALTPDVKKAAAPKVAIVYAQGEVVAGRGSDDYIYGYTLSETLRKVADDDDVKAVVVRVNSPGGSALASDIIWREMELLQQKKPVIVSMGSMAASGGYYIAAPADAIVANQLTLTGSIGVFGTMPNAGEALEKKVGITFDGVKSNKHADMGVIYSPLSPVEHQAMMRGVDKVYDRFTSLVAEGRNLTIERVLEIAEGRVWSGVDGQKIGLVDTCGGLDAALAIAVDKSGLGDNFQIVEVKDEMTGFMAMLEGLNVKVRQMFTSRSELGELYGEYKRLESLVGKKDIHAVCPYFIRIE